MLFLLILLSADEPRWTVHGLWPSRWADKHPHDCPGAAFNGSALSGIKADLERYWTNVHKNGREDSFWEHEWNKHGTCAAAHIKQLDTEEKYFK